MNFHCIFIIILIRGVVLTIPNSQYKSHFPFYGFARRIRLLRIQNVEWLIRMDKLFIYTISRSFSLFQAHVRYIFPSFFSSHFNQIECRMGKWRKEKRKLMFHYVAWMPCESIGLASNGTDIQKVPQQRAKSGPAPKSELFVLAKSVLVVHFPLFSFFSSSFSLLQLLFVQNDQMRNNARRNVNWHFFLN